MRKSLGTFTGIGEHLPTQTEIRALWAALRPDGGDTWKLEPWDQYWSRVGPLLPNFPPVAAEQWLWRHYTSVLDFSWLWLPALIFRSERWSVNRILEDIRGWPNHGLVENWAKYFQADPYAESDWLATYMRQAGTWPQPPMVIENNRQLQRPDGLELAAPFQLMEGHHRMGFFRALAAVDGGLEPEHDLLVVDVPAMAVLDYWPLNEGA